MSKKPFKFITPKKKRKLKHKEVIKDFWLKPTHLMHTTSIPGSFLYVPKRKDKKKS